MSEPNEQQNENESPNAEAARYRTQLRSAESERDAALGQLAAMQKAEVERIAKADVTKPDALWTAGVNLADLLADDGTVDPAKVKEATLDAADRLGLARRPVVSTHPPAGRNGRRPTQSKTFGDAFKINQG